MTRRDYSIRHKSRNEEQETSKTSSLNQSTQNSFSYMQQTIGNRAIAQLVETQVKDKREVPSVKGNESAVKLPQSLQSGIEALSGYSMDDVNVTYNSSKPKELGAHAYATGSDIHLAPGGEKHLPHEAWHVVQQKRGQVQATTKIGETPVNDNASLEQEATRMGEQADKLDGNDVAAAPSTRQLAPLQASGTSQLAVAQLAKATKNRSVTVDEDDIANYGDSIKRLLKRIEHCVEDGKVRALQWQDFENETEEAHLVLWYGMASDYVNNPTKKPKLLNARFGYAIETLACAELGDAFEDFELKYQITHGSTRPDIVVCIDDDELAWIDITSFGSEGHIAEKIGSGWKQKPFVHEVLYDALDPTELSNNARNPYLQKLGEFVGEEKDIVRIEQGKVKRTVATRMDKFAKKRKWQTGIGNAKNKAEDTREELYRAAGKKIPKPVNSMKATKGALTYLNLASGNYGFNSKDKQENGYIKSIIKGHAGDSIAKKKKGLNEEYNYELYNEFSTFSDEAAVKQFNLLYEDNYESRVLVQKGLALSAALEERENLLQLWQQVTESDSVTVDEQNEIYNVISSFPNKLSIDVLNQWIQEAIACKQEYEEDEDAMNIEDK